MSIDKPLHVRVAEALGLRSRPPLPCHGQCITQPVDGGDFPTPGRSTEPHQHGVWEVWTVDDVYGEDDNEDYRSWQPCPRYDLDWATTGPLIQKYGINLSYRRDGTGYWYASWPSSQPPDYEYSSRETVLISVCKLISDACCMRKREV